MSADPKQRAIGDFERTYHTLEGRLRALSPADLDLPVWTGDGAGWRIRDLIPHLARWQRIGAHAARLIGEGREPPAEADFFLRAFTGIDLTVEALNAETARTWRDRTDEERFTELNAAHTALMDALRALPPERVVRDDGEPFRYFWSPGLGHLEAHWTHIETALKEHASR